MDASCRIGVVSTAWGRKDWQQSFQLGGELPSEMKRWRELGFEQEAAVRLL